MHLLALLNPEDLLVKGSYLLLFGIIFAESGLLIGFFLPGDSLLFVAGMASHGAFAQTRDFHMNLWVVLVGVFLAAVIGDQVGYAFGNKVGPSLFRRPDSRLFKHENVEKAQAFFDRHGPKAIVLARFVPIVRTFVPVVAGVGHMEYKTFLRFNILGGFLWGVGVTLLGYFLGGVDFIHDNLEIALLAVVAVSLLPMLVEYLRHRRQAKHSAQV
jgi:membrane-associated protein